MGFGDLSWQLDDLCNITVKLNIYADFEWSDTYSVKSIETLTAPASKHPLISFSAYPDNDQHSATERKERTHLINKILLKNLPTIPLQGIFRIERVEQRKHGRCDDGLFHWNFCVGLGEEEVGVGVSFVPVN